MKRHNQQKMLELYNEWKESGLSQTEFAKSKDIRPSSFYYWISKFRSDSSKSKPSSSKGFCSITLNPTYEPHGQATAIIHYPSGARLEILAPLEAQLLKTLIE